MCNSDEYIVKHSEDGVGCPITLTIIISEKFQCVIGKIYLKFTDRGIFTKDLHT